MFYKTEKEIMIEQQKEIERLKKLLESDSNDKEHETDNEKCQKENRRYIYKSRKRRGQRRLRRNIKYN